SWTAVTAAKAGVQAGAKMPGIGGSSALDAGFLRKRCGRPMLPEVRSRVPPSTCRPPTITRVEHMCENLRCGVLRTRTETVPERYVPLCSRCQRLSAQGRPRHVLAELREDLAASRRAHAEDLAHQNCADGTVPLHGRRV